MKIFIVVLVSTFLLSQAWTAKPKANTGFRIQSIDKGSPLEAVGIRPGDVIKSINRVPATSLESVQKALADLNDKDSVQITVERKGKIVNLNFTVK